MTDSGYEALSQAIVRQACADWKKAIRRLHDSWYDKDALRIQRECERFFRSEWCYALTGTKSKDFMEMLWRTVE